MTPATAPLLPLSRLVSKVFPLILGWGPSLETILADDFYMKEDCPILVNCCIVECVCHRNKIKFKIFSACVRK